MINVVNDCWFEPSNYPLNPSRPFPKVDKLTHTDVKFFKKVS